MSLRARLVRRLHGDHGWAEERDEGFSLVELMVSLVLFAVLSTAVASSLQLALGLTRGNQARAVAANLAARQIETARAVSARTLVDQVEAVAVDGRIYTVTQTIGSVKSAAGSACDGAGTGPPGMRSVTVVVDWPDRGGIEPVRSETLRTLTLAERSGDVGSLSLRVVNRDNQPAPPPGHLVTLAPGGLAAQRTDDKGCVLFTGVPPGVGYTVSLATAGYVDPQGVSTPSRGPLTVSGGRLTKDPGFIYDRVTGGLTLTLPTSVETFPVPPTLLATVVNSSLSGGYRIASRCTASCPAPASWIANGLFPSPEGYQAWLGACSDARPAVTPAALMVQPGTTVSGVIPVARLNVDVVSSTGIAVSGVELQATSRVCSSETHVLGTTGVTGRVKTSLPAGAWDITAGLNTWPVDLLTDTTVRTIHLAVP